VRKQVPTEREGRAMKRGADELMNRCEHDLANRPRALRNARELYRKMCLRLYAFLERHFRRRR
jgi:hypothetical protein